MAAMPGSVGTGGAGSYGQFDLFRYPLYRSPLMLALLAESIFDWLVKSFSGVKLSGRSKSVLSDIPHVFFVRRYIFANGE